MTVQELIDFLTENCPDKSKLVLIHDVEYDQDNPIDFIDFDSDGYPVLY